MPPPAAEVWGQSDSGGDGWYCSAVHSLAGTSASTVQVAPDGTVLEMPLESEIGAACDGEKPASIRVCAIDGSVLLEEQSDRCDLGLTSP